MSCACTVIFAAFPASIEMHGWDSSDKQSEKLHSLQEFETKWNKKNFSVDIFFVGEKMIYHFRLVQRIMIYGSNPWKTQISNAMNLMRWWWRSDDGVWEFVNDVT